MVKVLIESQNGKHESVSSRKLLDKEIKSTNLLFNFGGHLSFTIELTRMGKRIDWSSSESNTIINPNLSLTASLNFIPTEYVPSKRRGSTINLTIETENKKYTKPFPIYFEGNGRVLIDTSSIKGKDIRSISVSESGGMILS